MLWPAEDEREEERKRLQRLHRDDHERWLAILYGIIAFAACFILWFLATRLPPLLEEMFG